tara:strand:+ start:4342 stop:4521 length:180 start_codon:yes stop_codon:yes gene_type:complete
METKSWYRSKTLWANGLVLIASLVAGASGGAVEVSPEDTAGILAVVNMILRLITTQGLV